MAPRDRWAPLYTTATTTLGSSTTILEQVANLSVLGDEGKSEEKNVALPLRGMSIEGVGLKFTKG